MRSVDAPTVRIDISSHLNLDRNMTKLDEIKSSMPNPIKATNLKRDSAQHNMGMYNFFVNLRTRYANQTCTILSESLSDARVRVC